MYTNNNMISFNYMLIPCKPLKQSPAIKEPI